MSILLPSCLKRARLVYWRRRATGTSRSGLTYTVCSVHYFRTWATTTPTTPPTKNQKARIVIFWTCSFGAGSFACSTEQLVRNKRKTRSRVWGHGVRYMKRASRVRNEVEVRYQD